ncbi:MAG: HAD family hydrolase [Phycisphaerales bacterium]|nr:HAD family hydrolase [Phycisphaerales bacterium]
MPRAVFLDRDNTIIHNDGDLGDASAVTVMAGAADAMKHLREAGFHLVVVTNQSGIARGVFTEADVASVHGEMNRHLAEATGDQQLVLAYYYSPWHPEGVVEAFRGDHPTRKPRPGMLLQAAEDHDLDLARSWMVGDQERDVEAGIAAGCRSLRLATTGTTTAGEARFDSLAEAAAYILEHDA